MSRFFALLSIAVGILTAAPAGAAQPTFEGKQITMVVGAAAAGTLDAYARLLARHMGRHLPGNPTFVVQNLAGAGGAAAAQLLVSPGVADGTLMGSVTRALTLDPLLTDQQFGFDPLAFNWLGSLNKDFNGVVISNTAPVKTFADVFTTETIVAATSASSDGVVYPNLMNRLLGTRFKVVAGYAGDAEMGLAVERGEAHGRGGVTWSAIKTVSADKLKDGSLKVIVQLGLTENPEWPGVPMLLDSVKDPKHRRIFELIFARQDMGRPFLLPPGVPADLVDLFRTAFTATAKDPQFLAEAQRLSLDINPLGGKEMQDMMVRLYKTPRDIVDETKKALKGD